MPIKWLGPQVIRKVREAQRLGIDATMQAAVIHAKDRHRPGAHSLRRFVTQTGELERSIRIVNAAKRKGRGTSGTWGSKGLAYAAAIELGVQGKSASGEAINRIAYPYLRPAAKVEYPKLKGRIKRAIAA